MTLFDFAFGVIFGFLLLFVFVIWMLRGTKQQKTSKTLQRDDLLAGWIKVPKKSWFSLIKSQTQVYAMLKNKSLFLYQDETRFHCLEALMLSKFKVSLFPNNLEDFESFSKKYPVLLESERKYFLFFDSCVDKEKWYFALLRSSQSSEYSSDQPPQYQQLWEKLNFQNQDLGWFNAILSRILLGVGSHDDFKNIILDRIMRKLSKVQTPHGSPLLVTIIDSGGTPLFSNPSLISFQPDVNVEVDFALRSTLEFCISTSIADISISLLLFFRSLEGRLRLTIFPPPSNRIWYAFVRPPALDFSFEAVNRVPFVKPLLDFLQLKLRKLFNSLLVLPNMDDICFFPNSNPGVFFPMEQVNEPEPTFLFVSNAKAKISQVQVLNK